MKLTRNLHLAEFEASAEGTRSMIDNRVPEALMPNLLKLAAACQAIRDHFGVPLIITSGYRCAHVNRLVGGSKNSDHIQALAADFIMPDYGSPREVCLAIAGLMARFGIGQLIHEFGRWVHVGVTPVAQINRIITIDHAGVRTGILPTRLA